MTDKIREINYSIFSHGILVYKSVFLVHESAYKPTLLMEKIKEKAEQYGLEDYQISIQSFPK